MTLESRAQSTQYHSNGFSHHMKVLRAEELAINSTHAIAAGSFKTPHRDPFDWMLAAQAQIEGLSLVSKDPLLRHFEVPMTW